MPVTLRNDAPAFALPCARHPRSAGLGLQALVRGVVLLFMLLTAGTAMAQQPAGITAGELASLPPYCPYTQTFEHDPRGANPTPDSAKWVQTLGKSFWGLHHYCWALIHKHRAKSAGITPAVRNHHWSAAVSDLGYVIQNSTADFVLLPEIYLRLGETYLLMGAPGNAVLAFTKSRELRPEYWPPYVAWADALAKLGKKNEARAHIEEGLRLMPSSVQLMASYRRLGGDPNRFLASLPAAARVTPASSPEGSGKADTSPTKAPRRPPPAASSAAG